MPKKVYKPSALIMENAREIYQRKNGKPLLTYQTPTTDCVLQAILDYLDDSNPDVEIVEPELPTIHLDDNDHQPQYRKK